MNKKYNLEALKEYSENIFLNYNSDIQFDAPFIDALSNKSKHLIKYLICKHSFTEEKFLFSVKEFNRFMRYINMPDPSDGIAELCTKEVLKKTKETNVYWVNNDLFNTGVFEPKRVVCRE